MGIRGEEITAKTRKQGGDDRVSQDPSLPAVKTKKRALHRRASRCPYTLDFIDGCADCDKPVRRAAEA